MVTIPPYYNHLKKGGEIMKAITVDEMRSIDGGWKTSYTVKCGYCGDKYTAKSVYFGALTYLYAYNSCKLVAGRWLRNHNDNHLLKAMGLK